MTAHAKLSPSGASRWMNCPGSINAEAAFPEESSVYADEGTRAHHLAERSLFESVHAAHFVGTELDGHVVTQEMADFVQAYIDHVRAVPGKHRFIEKRVDFSPWATDDSFGTCDYATVDSGIAYVRDLKYGQGVRVEAENNPQLMIYALGFLNEVDGIYEIDTFDLGIVQPRLDHVSEWRISRADLLAFGERVKAAAQLALSETAPHNPSEKACRFCKARRHCTARAEANLRIAAAEFAADFRIRNPETFDNTALGEVLPYLDELVTWAGDLRERAMKALMAGDQIPGHKLVEGRSVRQWAANEAAVIANLAAAGVKEDDLFIRKLLTIGAAEKLLGKKHKIFSEFTVKPPGKPTLAPATDPRPPLKQSAANDFSDAIDEDAA